MHKNNIEQFLIQCFCKVVNMHFSMFKCIYFLECILCTIYCKRMSSYHYMKENHNLYEYIVQLMYVFSSLKSGNNILQSLVFVSWCVNSQN